MKEAAYELKTLREVVSGSLHIADLETAVLWIKIAEAHISRLSALLDEAEAALGKVPSIEFADIGQVETQRFINTAASVSAKIAKEKSEETHNG